MPETFGASHFLFKFDIQYEEYRGGKDVTVN